MCGSHRETWKRRCDGALLVTLSDLFRIQGTLNQHGYHSIMQWYTIPSGLGLVRRSLVFQHDNDPTHLQAVYGLLTKKESDEVLHQMTWAPQSKWDSLGRAGLQSEGKAANKCSAYVGTPWKLLLKTAFQVKLVERMPRVCKAVIKAKGDVIVMSSLLFYNVENSKNKGKPLTEQVCQNFWLVLYISPTCIYSWRI
jgi:hypothetical protein